DIPLFARHGVWTAFDPFDRFLKRLTLPQPKTRDQLLGFRKWTIGYDSFLSREFHSGAFRTRLQPFPGEHYAGLVQFVVELAHISEKLRARQLAPLRILAGFDDYHESHFGVSFSADLVSVNQAVAPATSRLEYSSARCFTEQISATGRTSTTEPYSRPGHCFAISMASFSFATVR